AQLLDLSLSVKNDQLHFDLGNDSWTKLARSLARAHETSNPATVANQVINNWIVAHGPAFANWRTRSLDRILQTASGLGFREIGSRDDLADRCEKAWRDWTTFQRKVRQEAFRAKML